MKYTSIIIALVYIDLECNKYHEQCKENFKAQFT